MTETHEHEKLIQIADFPKMESPIHNRFIADGIMKTEKNFPIGKQIKPFEIYYCLKNGIYWIKMCYQCLKDEEENLEEGKEGPTHTYFKSIGLDLNDLSGKTHEISHGLCECCAEAFEKEIDKLPNVSNQTSAVLNSEEESCNGS